MTTDTRMMKSALFAGCALFALAGTAHAADAPAAPAAPAATNEAPLAGEIVVTAQRRTESIQNVPFTLQAFSGDALSKLNVTTFSDLLKYTPNVTFGNNGPGQGAIYMRGLSVGFAGNQSSGTIAPFPNVALYLDDQSMQFPARNADVYVADMERVEVLEGPQGTLFGGGAEAGVVRYITNKPKLDKFEGKIEGSFGGTVGGAPNGAFNATINLPIINDKLAIRATIYDDHHGGYINNVYSTFTRSASDPGAVAYAYTPSSTNQSQGGQYNNADQVKNNYNPVDYLGGRVAVKWQATPDWDVLISESYQSLDAEGTFSTYPTGSDFQNLGALQTTTFSPSYNKDDYWNTAWTINGKIGDFKVIYTGAYLIRNISEQQDYTNYSRSVFGMYYQCTGSQTGFGVGGNDPTYCYSPKSDWHDTLRNRHTSHEFRISSPEGKRIRAIVGAYYEAFHIQDTMNFNYKSIPACTTSGAAGGDCIGLLQPYPGAYANDPHPRGPATAFGEDTQRGYDQLAAFGSVDFDILPNLTVTGGTRYYDYKEWEGGSQYATYVSNCFQVVICGTSGGNNVNIDNNGDHVHYHGFKSKGELTWKPIEHTLVYALFSQGFRPGGFNRTPLNVLSSTPWGLSGQTFSPQYIRPNSYKPDTLTNWEAGLKTDLLDRKVTLNLSGYYMIWQNVPFGFFNPAAGIGNTTFFTNGPNYHIKGGELQIVTRPTKGLTVQGSATYNDSKQVNSPCFIANYPGTTNIAGQPNAGQCVTDFYAKKSATSTEEPQLFGPAGGVTPFSPHIQANARARYDWAGKNDITWFVSGGVSYTGPMYNQPANYIDGNVANPPFVVPTANGSLYPATTTLRYRQNGYALLDAQVGLSRDTWSVTVFGENLTNTHSSTFTSTAQFIKSEVPVRPMTYGVKIGKSF